MSRIQNVLDKAERDGAMHRMRGVAEPAAASVATTEVVPPRTTETVDPPAWIDGAQFGRVIQEPHLGRRLTTVASNGTVMEQYRALRTRILHADNGSAVNVVLVTSPGRNEGRSLTVAGLGLTMAQEYQRRICIVDADLRNPQQHRLFDIPETPGLSDILAGRATLDDACVTLEAHHLTVLPAGTLPAHPAELLGTTTMRRTIDTLRSRFDAVLVDAPGATPLADVSILTPFVDSVLMVIRAGVTSKPSIHDAIAALDGSKLLGMVLNDAA